MFKQQLSISWVQVLGGVSASSLILLAYRANNQTHLQPEPRAQTLIVKYGGSAVTNKASFETLNCELLSKSSVQLKIVCDEERWSNIIIVHGAGSFGHFHAQKYGLKFGGTSAKDNSENVLEPWQTGLTLTRQSVLKLNKHVVDAHVSMGLPVVSVSAFPSVVTGYQSSCKTRQNAASCPSINSYGSHIVESGALSEVNSILSAGLIPVLHGDVVLDRSQRCAILGGDHIIHWYVNSTINYFFCIY